MQVENGLAMSLAERLEVSLADLFGAKVDRVIANKGCGLSTVECAWLARSLDCRCVVLPVGELEGDCWEVTFSDGSMVMFGSDERANGLANGRANAPPD